MRHEEGERARVRLCAESMQAALELGWLDIEHKFTTTHDPEKTCCTSYPEWKYRQGSMVWNLTVTVTLTDDELEAITIHELAHFLTDCLWGSIPEGPKKEALVNLNELATENVARAIMAAMR